MGFEPWTTRSLVQRSNPLGHCALLLCPRLVPSSGVVAGVADVSFLRSTLFIMSSFLSPTIIRFILHASFHRRFGLPLFLFADISKPSTLLYVLLRPHHRMVVSYLHDQHGTPIRNYLLCYISISHAFWHVHAIVFNATTLSYPLTVTLIFPAFTFNQPTFFFTNSLFSGHCHKEEILRIQNLPLLNRIVDIDIFFHSVSTCAP